MITNLVLLAFFVGVTFGVVVFAAVVWARDLQLKMTTWKWVLTAVWYLLLLFTAFLGFTFIGEGEAGAGIKVLAVFLFVLLVLGMGLVRLIGIRESQRGD